MTKIKRKAGAASASDEWPSWMHEPLPRPVPAGVQRPAWFKGDDAAWEAFCKKRRDDYVERFLRCMVAAAEEAGIDLNTLSPSQIKTFVAMAVPRIPALKASVNPPYRLVPTGDDFRVERPTKRGRPAVDFTLNQMNEMLLDFIADPDKPTRALARGIEQRLAGEIEVSHSALCKKVDELRTAWDDCETGNATAFQKNIVEIVAPRQHSSMRQVIKNLPNLSRSTK